MMGSSGRGSESRQNFTARGGGYDLFNWGRAEGGQKYFVSKGSGAIEVRLDFNRFAGTTAAEARHRHQKRVGCLAGGHHYRRRLVLPIFGSIYVGRGFDG